MAKELFAQLKFHLNYLSSNEQNEIEKAFLFAKKAHENQIRSSGESYITHPVAAAIILASLNTDVHTIVAALLHDVIEDTNCTKALIAKEFSLKVANIVDGVSKLNYMNYNSKLEASAQNFRKMALATVDDIRVILVKLADRLHNMRTIYSLKRSKRIRIAKETMEIYGPIANRLGLNNFSLELENLSFKTIYPWRYKVLEAAIEKQSIKHSFVSLRQNILDKLKEHNITNCDISFREKHLYSIYQKMQQKKSLFEEVQDKHGMRIIVSDKHECYKTLGIIHSLYKPLEKKFKDYIAIPKSNGYQSLHTVVFGPGGSTLEIQIRTFNMHKVAKMGVAAHWIYKIPVSKSINFFENFKAIEPKSMDTVDLLNSVKDELSYAEIHVFTPTGDVVTLPLHSTPIDFAYALSSEVGDHCIGCKINEYHSPLDQKLVSGQTIYIITKPYAKPHHNWLNFVKTSKAKTKIKFFLAHKLESQAKILGKHMLWQALKKYQYDLKSLKQKLRTILKVNELKDLNHLYKNIGLGKVLPDVLLSLSVKNKADSDGINIEGLKDIDVTYKDCCRPIPGDTIVGEVVPKEGLVIHRYECKKANLSNSFRLEWGNDLRYDYLVDIVAKVYDQKGVLAYLANAIAAQEANIKHMWVTNKGQTVDIGLSISVKSKDHLNNLITKINNLKYLIGDLKRKDAF